MTAMGGSGNLTLSTRLLTTLVAQETNPATSLARSVTADSKLLSAMMALIFFSDTTFLLFRLEQSGVSGGLTSRALYKATTSSLDFSRFSMYWDFNLASVIHCLLDLRAKNKSARRNASCVASAGAMVVVGTRKNGKFAVVGPIVEELHEPDQVTEVGVSEVCVLLVVVKGKTPEPGVPDVEDLVDSVCVEDMPDLLVLISLLELDDLLIWLFTLAVLILELEVLPDSVVWVSMRELEVFPEVTESVGLVELEETDSVIKGTLEDEVILLELEKIVAFWAGVPEADLLTEFDFEVVVRETADQEVVLVPTNIPVPVPMEMELLLGSIVSLG